MDLTNWIIILAIAWITVAFFACARARTGQSKTVRAGARAHA
jgi:hypothetical protein